MVRAAVELANGPLVLASRPRRKANSLVSNILPVLPAVKANTCVSLLRTFLSLTS